MMMALIAPALVPPMPLKRMPAFSMMHTNPTCAIPSRPPPAVMHKCIGVLNTAASLIDRDPPWAVSRSVSLPARTRSTHCSSEEGPSEETTSEMNRFFFKLSAASVCSLMHLRYSAKRTYSVVMDIHRWLPR
jgi:hypothetical protein